MVGLIRNNIRNLRYRLLPRSLLGRSLMILIVPVLFLQISVAFVFFDRHWDTMSKKLAYAVAGEIAMVAHQLAETTSTADAEKIIVHAAENLQFTIRIENTDDNVLRPLDSSFQKFYWFSIGTKLTAALDRHLDMKFTVRPYENDKVFVVSVLLRDGMIAHFLCPERRLTSSATYVFLLWMIGGAVILFSVAIVFMRNQIRPIMRLAVAAEKLGKGQDVPHFRPVGATEVRRASTAFLEMKDRLKRQMEQRTAMLSGVSHDLRTPITRLKLQLAIAKHSPEIDNMREDIEEMERMIEGYLAFVRGEGDETPEDADIAAILRRVVGNAQRQGKEGTVTCDAPERMMHHVRPLAIERAISNIVMNAVKYAHHVFIRAVREEHGGLTIIVDDDGSGIPEDRRTEVFRPFFRLEKSRNKKTGGIGLGLSIAQDVVHAHGGEIVLTESPQNGLRVVIMLPA